MHSIILKRFQALEDRRIAMVHRVSQMPVDRQTSPGPRGALSPAQVVGHMAAADRLLLSFIAKAPPSSIKGKRARQTVMFKLMLKMFRKPPFQIPTAPFAVPSPTVTLEKAAADWAEERTKVIAILDQIEGPDTPTLKFLPMLGILSASSYLDLLEAHQDYHEARFPK